MRFILAVALKDLQIKLTDATALFTWFGIPLLVGGMIALISSGGPPQATLLVVDHDRSVVSRGLQALSGSVPMPVTLELVGEDEGRERIDDGDATAMLVIPAGFGEALLRETPVTLELVTNPSQRILPAIVSEALKGMSDAVFYLHRFIGGPLKQIGAQVAGDGFPDDAEVGGVAESLSRDLRARAGALFPPVLQVTTVLPPEAKRKIPMSLWFLPGALVMSLVFIARGMSDDIWIERNQGTLRRLVCTPHGLVAMLAGKMLAVGIIAFGIALVVVPAAVAAFNIPPWTAPPAVLWCALAAVAMFPLFLLAQMLGRTAKAGHLIATMLMFPMLMLGGSFFPLEALPDSIGAIGAWTPNGTATVALKQLVIYESGPTVLLVPGVCLLVPALVLTALSVRRLKRGFVTG